MTLICCLVNFVPSSSSVPPCTPSSKLHIHTSTHASLSPGLRSGLTKHGYGKLDLVRDDPSLCFAQVCKVLLSNPQHVVGMLFGLVCECVCVFSSYFYKGRGWR